MHIIIVGDTAKPGVKEMMLEVKNLCASKGVFAEAYEVRPDRLDILADTTANLIIVLGGDGAILGAAKALTGNQVEVIGINFGKLGYMASIDQTEANLCDINGSDESFEIKYREETVELLEALAHNDDYIKDDLVYKAIKTLVGNFHSDITDDDFKRMATISHTLPPIDD